MKLIIDIDESLLVGIKSDNFDFARQVVKSFQATIASAIANGIPIPDNATNGDVIRALFKPNRVERTDDDVIVENYDFSKKWWNSPYQKGGKE